MSILALDTGTHCGYAVENGPSGVWNLTPSRFDSKGVKFIKFKNYLLDIIEKYKIHYVVYEEVHRHIGTDASHSYGGLVAVLQLVCLEKGIEYQGVGVGTIKKYATGKGSASKEEMVKSAIQKYKATSVLNDDHADSLHLLDYAQNVIFSHPQNELGLTP